MDQQKKKSAVWMHPSTRELIEKRFLADDCKSRSEFIEKAVRFYCGYIEHDKNKSYLPQVMVSTFKAMLDSYEDRQAALLFKLAVELSMMLHVTAATNDIDEEMLDRLRGRCVQEVKALRGLVSLDKAVRFQNED